MHLNITQYQGIDIFIKIINAKPFTIIALYTDASPFIALIKYIFPDLTIYNGEKY